MGLDHGRRRAGDRHAAPLRLGHGSQRSHPPGAPEGRGEHHLPLGAVDGLPAARARCGADAGADEGGGRTAAPPARRARGPLRGGHGSAGRRRAPARVAAILAAPMIVVAANPYSGASDNRRRVEAVARELAALGEHPCVGWGARERAAMLGDRAAMTGCRAVVAAGGDGTVAQVINELPPGTPLAAFPAGNENLFASAYGFADDPAALARALAAGRTRTLDLGRASGPGRSRLFALMLSAGLDAEVVRRLMAWRTTGSTLRRVRRASYVAPVPVQADGDPLGTTPVEVDVVPGALTLITSGRGG